MTDEKHDAGPLSEPDDSATERETVLMALDQISQTIDVMTSVVGRLRSQVEARGEAHGRARTEAESDRDKGGNQGKDMLPAGSSPDRILH